MLQDCAVELVFWSSCEINWEEEWQWWTIQGLEWIVPCQVHCMEPVMSMQKNCNAKHIDRLMQMEKNKDYVLWIEFIIITSLLKLFY